MRVFITGIEGFVGRHLADLLRAAGHEVAGSALSGGDGDGVVELDVRDRDRVDRAIWEARPDVLFHTAAARKYTIPAQSASPA